MQFIIIHQHSTSVNTPEVYFFTFWENIRHFFHAARPRGVKSAKKARETQNLTGFSGVIMQLSQLVLCSAAHSDRNAHTVLGHRLLHMLVRKAVEVEGEHKALPWCEE